MEKSSIISIFLFALLFLHSGMPTLLKAQGAGLECLKNEDCNKNNCNNPQCICTCGDKMAANGGVEPSNIPPCSSNPRNLKMGTEGNSSNSPTPHESKKIKLTHHFQTHITEETPNFPEEIIVEILARLPIKSLLKFRCVSKSWLSVISSPQFIKFHLKLCIKDATFSKYRIMFTVSYPHFGLKQCSINSLMFKPSSDVFDVNYPKESPHRAVWVVGSCNGLICIAINEKQLFLWNPATRVSTKLPTVNVKLNPGFYNLYGFGYDECADDYKVLGIFVEYGIGREFKSIVKMYSLKSNSWKRIGNFQGGVPLDDSGQFASGKLHFSMTSGFSHDSRWDIASIDLNTEVYGIVEQPNYGEGHFDFTLGVLGGCVCVISNYGNICADLWVLKEYGVKESWTKMVTISDNNGSARCLFSGPLLMIPDGKILLLLGMHLVVYNPKDNSLRRPEMRNLSTFLMADIYVESLVSPAAG
ncbi:hypothetical protein BUALT_Bualt17G0088500 [Buddleja alternifolia]|uniref:F-box domain-containing protein n=1 Tax=Buddleja alternifolia TaxID=168488 RepID=A0AAV6WHS3_9LAMI|nr:hypothetical protein BUALT_Bualt17G0088300 [Buddleja alternifolia]KAG8366520.1 hypothetical protein BUALT_Bualt17G0088500 [Buddleja alternifolia]